MQPHGGIDDWPAKGQGGRVMAHCTPLMGHVRRARERLTAPGALRWGCGSRPELPVSLLRTASLARTPYGSYRGRESDDDDKLCAVCKVRQYNALGYCMYLNSCNPVTTLNRLFEVNSLSRPKWEKKFQHLKLKYSTLSMTFLLTTKMLSTEAYL